MGNPTRQQKTETPAEFFKPLLTGIEPRVVEHNGATVTVYVRRLRAGEQLELNKGIRFTVTPRDKQKADGAVDQDTDSKDVKMQTQASGQIDLGDNLRRQHMLVAFAICRDQQGNKLFSGANEVGGLEGSLVAKLHKIAEEFNREETEEGKADSTTATPETSSASE